MTSELSLTTKAIAKCGRVLYAFSSFYFPFYDREPNRVFYEFDPYAWISAYVYDIDERVENGSGLSITRAGLSDLKSRLEQLVPASDVLDRLFVDALRYYTFEQGILSGYCSYSLEELSDILALRSFDFRMLHRVLAYQAKGEYSEPLFNWFKSFEAIMEIEDDLQSIGPDAEAGTFNFAVLAHRILGPSAADFIRFKLARAEERLKGELETMTAGQQLICKNVMQKYRTIVPRIQISVATCLD